MISMISQRNLKREMNPGSMIQFTIQESIFIQFMIECDLITDSLWHVLQPLSSPAQESSVPEAPDVAASLELAMAEELAQAALEFERKVQQIREKYQQRHEISNEKRVTLSNSAPQATSEKDSICGLCCDEIVHFGKSFLILFFFSKCCLVFFLFAISQLASFELVIYERIIKIAELLQFYPKGQCSFTDF